MVSVVRKSKILLVVIVLSCTVTACGLLVRTISPNDVVDNVSINVSLGNGSQRCLASNDPFDQWMIRKGDENSVLRLVREFEVGNLSTRVFEFKSLKWENFEGELIGYDRTAGKEALWNHTLIIATPSRGGSDIDSAFVFLIETLGSNITARTNAYHVLLSYLIEALGSNITARTISNSELAPFFLFAEEVNVPVILVLQIPPRGLSFVESDLPGIDERTSSNDSNLGASIRLTAIKNSPEYNLIYPMVKAGMIGGTLAKQYLNDQQGYNIKRLHASGISKNGWATYMLAAFDQGPCGKNEFDSVVPIVFPGELKQCVAYQYKTINALSLKYPPYVETEAIPQLATDQRFDLFNRHGVPKPYFNRLKNTRILQFYGSSDRFFPVECINFNNPVLEENNRELGLRIMTNVGHVDEARPFVLFNELVGFVKAFEHIDKPIPRISSSFREGAIVATIEGETPRRVYLVQAESSTRNFNLDAIGRRGWKSSRLSVRDDGRYVVDMRAPSSGFRAAYLEFHYGNERVFTTTPYVLPDRFDFPGLEGAGGP